MIGAQQRNYTDVLLALKVIERLHHNTLRIKNLDTNEELACHVTISRNIGSQVVPLAEYEISQKKSQELHQAHNTS